jgi:hypothetical protein
MINGGTPLATDSGSEAKFTPQSIALDHVGRSGTIMWRLEKNSQYLRCPKAGINSKAENVSVTSPAFLNGIAMEEGNCYVSAEIAR